MSSVVIIDGKNFFSRLFHVGLRIVDKNKLMEFIFKNYIDTINKKYNRYTVYFVDDTCKSERRLKIYPEYKAGRKTSLNEEELKMFKEMSKDFRDIIYYSGGICLYGNGYEADDYISMLVYILSRHKIPIIEIFSSDQDFLQLISDNVTCYLPTKQLTINKDNFYDIMNIRLSQYLEYKILKGDNSDNISGVKGIGDKKAKKLLEEYGDISNMIAELKLKDKLNKSEKKILDAEKDIHIFRELMDLSMVVKDKNLYKTTILQVKSKHTNKEKLLKLFNKYKLNSIYKDIIKTVKNGK